MTIRHAVYTSIYVAIGIGIADEIPTPVEDDHKLSELGLDDLGRLEVIEDIEEALGVDMFDLAPVVDAGEGLTVGELIEVLEAQ